LAARALPATLTVVALLVHLSRRYEWTACTREGLYLPRSFADEGFVHLCRPQEAVTIANRLFANADHLLAVAIDSRRLRAELLLDQDRPGAFAWPHLHGPLALDAVVSVLPYPRRPDGRYPRLPAELRELDCGPPLRFHDDVTAVEAVAVLELLAGAEIEPVVDGGWAVDAVLERQTRDHGDLDLCLDSNHVDRAIQILGEVGYEVMEDERPTRVALRSRGGLGPQVDIHPLAFDLQGNGTQDLGNGASFTYAAGGLAGVGVIGGRRARCLTPELQVACHCGYEPDEDDYDDVAALAALLRVDPPPPFDR
jgi:lincosamide nucleotidyltransferase A/C/D/E